MTTSLRKNSIMMVLYEVLTLIVPLVLTPYVSRTIGASGIGIYSYSFSVVSYFVDFKFNSACGVRSLVEFCNQLAQNSLNFTSPFYP